MFGDNDSVGSHLVEQLKTPRFELSGPDFLHGRILTCGH
jgi:hypothetical protein